MGRDEAFETFPEGLQIRKDLAEKVKRVKLAPLEQLCEEGSVPSLEILAGLLPTMVANVITSGRHHLLSLTLSIPPPLLHC